MHKFVSAGAGLYLALAAATSAAQGSAPDLPICVFPAMQLDGRYPHLHPRLEAEFVIVVRGDGNVQSVRMSRSSGNPAFDQDAMQRLRASDCRNAKHVRGINPADVRAVVQVPVTVSAAARPWAAR